MYVVSFVSFVAIYLTYLESRGRLKNGMFLGFVLVAIIGAVRYNYGNDYSAYMSIYKEINSMPFHWDNLVNGDYKHEPGWVLINLLFDYLGGFFIMVAVISLIQNIIFYYFIICNVEKRQWTLAIIIYLLSTTLYILFFSMIRQGLAISLFVLTWTFIKKKKFIQTLLVIGIASTIHYSAQILLPIALFPFIPFGKKVISGIYIVLFIAFYVSSDLLANSFETITAIGGLQSAQSLDYYTKEDTTIVTYGLGFIINLIPFIISMWAFFARDNMINNENKLLIMISMISYVIAPFAMIIPLLVRFGMYFSAYCVVSIPFIYSLLSNKSLYTFLMSLYLFMLIYSYYMFYHSEVWAKSYSTFHTVFEML